MGNFDPYLEGWLIISQFLNRLLMADRWMLEYEDIWVRIRAEENKWYRRIK